MRLEILLLFYLTSACYAYFQGGGTNDGEEDLIELPLRLKRLLHPLLKQYPTINNVTINNENKLNKEDLHFKSKLNKRTLQKRKEISNSEKKDLIILNKDKETKHECRAGCVCGRDCPCKSVQRNCMTMKRVEV
ncbi:hypothetical protein O3M35_005063 [Rhynocoris fuscipes]|uniref:Uncharacterized protein n=1 Tax=Rhynocoris fuscipes TaxID=488301 RepID=A0AAW1DHQ3_9HEMI